MKIVLMDDAEALPVAANYGDDEASEEAFVALHWQLHHLSSTASVLKATAENLKVPLMDVPHKHHSKQIHADNITHTLYRNLYTHSFIHSGHFYSASSSPLLLRGDPDYSTDTV